MVQYSNALTLNNNATTQYSNAITHYKASMEQCGNAIVQYSDAKYSTVILWYNVLMFRCYAPSIDLSAPSNDSAALSTER